MKLLYLPFIVIIAIIINSCSPDYSCSNCLVKTDSLPANYPFSSGLCVGSKLSADLINPLKPLIPADNFIASTSDSLPNAVSLDMPTPGDQSIQGSCAAWASIYAAGSYFIHNKYKVSYDSILLSPAYTYNQITKGNCSCTSIYDNLYILYTQGAATLSSMPYDASDCSRQPDSTQRKVAAKYFIDSINTISLTGIDTVKRALYERKAIIFSMHVDDAFKGIIYPPILKNYTGSGGAHALVICGYDNAKNAFKVQNSWSTAWGDKGYLWIDYDCFLKIINCTCNDLGKYGYI